MLENIHGKTELDVNTRGCVSRVNGNSRETDISNKLCSERSATSCEMRIRSDRLMFSLQLNRRNILQCSLLSSQTRVQSGFPKCSMKGQSCKLKKKTNLCIVR